MAATSPPSRGNCSHKAAELGGLQPSAPPEKRVMLTPRAAPSWPGHVSCLEKRCIWHRRSSTLAKTGKSQQRLSTGKWKSSNTCDGSSPEPLAELPAPLRLGVFFPGDLAGPGRIMGVKGDKALRGTERCQQPLVYLPCYAIAPPVLLLSRSEPRQQPTLLAAVPGCWVLAAPSGLHPIPLDTPSPPPKAAPAHQRQPRCPRAGFRLHLSHPIWVALAP